jgi:recombination protein RecR
MECAMSTHHYPPSIRALIRNISRLPGIGEKSAERLAMHLLQAPRAEAEQLARSIVELKEKVRRCARCYGLSDGEQCQICSDPARHPEAICVVEQFADLVAIEKSGAFKGLYHVLQGALSPMNGIGPDQLRVAELLQRIAGETVREVVIATATNVEGEATAAYLGGCLQPFAVRVTRIACGVPMGGDLKFIDQVTLKRAMETRRAIPPV